jgi:hypothetical protein
MRRPVTILAGLLLAAGSSFAMALPASAAVSHGTQSSAVSYDPYDWDDDYSYVSFGNDFDSDVYNELNNRNYSSSQSNPYINIVNRSNGGSPTSIIDKSTHELTGLCEIFTKLPGCQEGTVVR